MENIFLPAAIFTGCNDRVQPCLSARSFSKRCSCRILPQHGVADLIVLDHLKSRAAVGKQELIIFLQKTKTALCNNPRQMKNTLEGQNVENSNINI